MSQELSKNEVGLKTTQKKPSRKRLYIFLLPLWVVICFLLSQFTLYAIIQIFPILGINLSDFNEPVLVLAMSAFVYILMTALAIGLPWLIKKRETSREDIGLTRLPTWTDILLSPAGLVVYMISSVILALVLTSIFPSINMDQAQETGFDNLSLNYEYYLAFFALVVLAPVAEELLFRGYLYGKLKKHVPIWVAILATSVTFAAIHGAWNLAIDTFALSIVLCILRELTGNIWSSILLHMMKNGVAYYFLFINTALLTTLGG